MHTLEAPHCGASKDYTQYNRVICVEKSVKEGARSGGNFSLHEHIMFKVSYLMASCPV